MPKIQEYSAPLIEAPKVASPELVKQGPGTVVDVASFGQVGKSLENFSQGISAFEKKLSQARQASEYANLSVGATKELHELGLKYQLDTDYGTLSSRYADEAQKIVSKYLDQATDPTVKNHLTLKLGNDYASGITSIGNIARKGVVDQLSADVLGRLEERKRIASQQTGDDFYRTMSEQMGDIDGMIKAGVIKAEEGQKLKNKFRQDVEANQINQMKFVDPYGAIKVLQDPNNFPNASPEFKQRALEGATKKIDILDRAAIASAERAERKAEKDLKVWQTSNFAKAARENKTPEDIYKMLENREIDETHALRLMDRRQRDIDADTQFADKQIDAMFRTEGPFGKFDSVNETYRAQLKRELNERVFNKENPENPMNVLDEIIVREKDRLTAIRGGQISNSPIDAFPRPRFFSPGVSLDEIKKKTVEAYKSGQMDETTFSIESRKIYDLEMGQYYADEQKRRMGEVKEKTKPKQAN